MRENGFMASDVSLEELAAKTKNFSGSGIIKKYMNYLNNIIRN